MATAANPHSILFTTGPFEPIWRTLSSSVHLIGVSVLSYCIACRTHRLSLRDWQILPLNRWLVLLIFIDSWLFIFSAGLLISGVGLAFNSHSCSAGIFLCIVLYVTTKLLIYWFLVEKVHIVHPSYSRWKSGPYKLCMLFILGYFGIIVFMILGRIAFVRNGHQPLSVHDSATDGACVIGLQPAASLSLLVYDLILNVFFTCMFLYPIYKSPNLSPRLKLIAKRTLIAAFIALLTSVVNICVLTVLHGKELGAICLGSCGLDTTVNALAVFAVTSPINDSTSQEPSSKQTDNGGSGIIKPKPIIRGVHSSTGGGGGNLETLENPQEYRGGNGTGTATRSVHFPPEVTRQESRVAAAAAAASAYGMPGGSGGSGSGTVTVIEMEEEEDEDRSREEIGREVERRRRDEADRLERGWMGMRVGMGDDVIQPGIMDEFGPAAMVHNPPPLLSPPPPPPAGTGSSVGGDGDNSGLRPGPMRTRTRTRTGTTNEVYPVIRPSDPITQATTGTTRASAGLITPPPPRQYRPHDGRGSPAMMMMTTTTMRTTPTPVMATTGATTTMTSSIISSDYPRPGTPEETSVEIKHEVPTSLMAVTATKFRALSASTRVKAKATLLPWSATTTNDGHTPPGSGTGTGTGSGGSAGQVDSVNEKGKVPVGIVLAAADTLELGDAVEIEMKERGEDTRGADRSSSLSVPILKSTKLLESTTSSLEDVQGREEQVAVIAPTGSMGSVEGRGGEGSSGNGSLRLAPATTTAVAAAVATAATRGRTTTDRPLSMSLEVSVTTQTDQTVEQVRRKKPRGLIEDYDGSQSSTRTRRSRNSTGGL